MIRSMTGFAAQTREDDQATVSVTLRAVNHRFLDFQARLPPSLADMESRLRAIVQERIGRGRVELTVNLQLRRQPAVTVEMNEPLIDAIAAVLEQARAKGIVTGALQPGDLLRLPQALAIRERAAPDGDGLPEDVRRTVEATVVGAVEELDTMRGREGAFLLQDLESRLTLLGDLVERVTQAAEAGRKALETRLADRVRDLGADSLTDPAAIAQEIVRFVARSDVTEEIVRFRSHLAHWRALAEAPEPCGRKLDFLIQEMNREANTIGSKAEGEGAPPIVVAIKAELEKIREQVQNVE
jgi:uncharacterized protein (TIGR00255 family)